MTAEATTDGRENGSTVLRHGAPPQSALAVVRRFGSHADQAIDEQVAAMLRAELGDVMDIWEAVPRITNNLRINGSNGKIQAKIKGVYTTMGEISPRRVRNAIYEVSELLDVRIDEQYPIFSGEYPLDKSRIQIILERACDNPIMVWRRGADVAKTFEELAAEGVFTFSQVEFINEAFDAREKNFVLSGATDSGKTYNCHGFMQLFAKYPERFLLLLEDAKELLQVSDNVERLYARRGFGRAPDVLMQDCVEIALRMDPDIIAMGELRTALAAKALFEAWNTGHSGGFVTYHANSARDSIRRMDWLLRSAGVIPVPEELANTLHVLIHVKQVKPNVRRAVEVVEVTGYKNGDYVLRHVA